MLKQEIIMFITPAVGATIVGCFFAIFDNFKNINSFDLEKIISAAVSSVLPSIVALMLYAEFIDSTFLHDAADLIELQF